MRLLGCLKTVVLSLLILAIGVYAGYRSEWVQKKFFYPFYYQEIVYKYANINDVNPFLVSAVIKNESKFKPKAVSPKGAKGLMQLMPETAVWIASQIKINHFKLADLEDPEINIRMGTWYLAELKQEFKDNDVLVLAAYNGGRGNVKEWMQKYGWTYTFKDIDRIPFRETREYVKKVKKDREQYQLLYGR